MSPHRTSAPVQAAERGRRLLARRREAARCCSASTARRGKSKKALADHLHRLEEAAKRDHRKLANELDLLVFPERARWRARRVASQGRDHPQADGGLLPRSRTRPAATSSSTPRIWRTGSCSRPPGTSTSTPTACTRRWRWTTAVLPEADELPDAQPDLQQRASGRYRELPLRLFELGTVYRYERSGTLHGLHAHPRLHPGRQPHLLHEGAAGRRDPQSARLRAVGAARLRVRGLRPQPVDQGPRQVRRHRRDLGRGHRARFAAPSTPHDLDYGVEGGRRRVLRPEDRHRRAETPSAGRWQLSTIQVDFNLPERFDLEYVGADGDRHTADHVAPGAVRFDRTVLRRAHRALRRGLPDVARSDAGARAPGRRSPRTSTWPRWSHGSPPPGTSGLGGGRRQLGKRIRTAKPRRSRTFSWSATTTSPPTRSG